MHLDRVTVKEKLNQGSHELAVRRQKFRSWVKRSVMQGRRRILGEDETLRDSPLTLENAMLKNWEVTGWDKGIRKSRSLSRIMDLRRESFC